MITMVLGEHMHYCTFIVQMVVHYKTTNSIRRLEEEEEEGLKVKMIDVCLKSLA